MILAAIDVRLKQVEKLLTYVSWTVTVLATLMIVFDICMRYFFNKPLPASWEICELCMPYIVFLPFAYTLSLDGHVKVTLVTERLSWRARFVVGLVSDVLSFLICAMLTYWSWIHFWESFSIREEMLAAISLPWWVGKFAMPVGLAMFTIRYAMMMCARGSNFRAVG